MNELLVTVLIVLAGILLGGVGGGTLTGGILERSHLRDLDRLKVHVDEARVDRDYWKHRAEQLIDAALLKGGSVPGPVMQPPPKSKDRAAQLVAGMGISEIDSRAKPS